MSAPGHRARAHATFDAIVVGSGITGGWAAKELTEAGLKVLLLERGRHIEHQVDYTTELKAPWDLPFHGAGNARQWAARYPVQQKNTHFDEWIQRYWVDDVDNPYVQANGPFNWFRGYHLGGRSLMWGRQSYRWSDVDFGANARDGIGSDWPIRYADLAPWYDHVEEFVGVSGQAEGVESLPDGRFQPPMALNAVEAHVKQVIEKNFPGRKLTIGRTANLTEPKPELGRAQCQNRAICARGCSFGAYFSTQSSTLPAARATGNLTLVTDALVEGIDYDPKTKRATGVRVLDTRKKSRTHYTSKLVFLCAGSFNSVALLLRSANDAMPNGFANSSGVLGRYVMDHGTTLGAVAVVPGFEQRTYRGNRPTGIIVPRFVNVGEKEPRPFSRGYSFQGGAYRAGWTRGGNQAGLGVDFKKDLRGPGDWKFVLTTFVECLPRAENRITLEPVKVDSNGAPQLRVEFAFGENEKLALADAKREATAMLQAAGARVLFGSDQPNPGGSAIHEMGGARMGRDPQTSVLNAHNQTHDVPNVFVTDGAAMASSACQNPSLTYMAITARAARTAAEWLKQGAI